MPPPEQLRSASLPTAIPGDTRQRILDALGDGVGVQIVHAFLGQAGVEDPRGAVFVLQAERDRMYAALGAHVFAEDDDVVVALEQAIAELSFHPNPIVARNSR